MNERVAPTVEQLCGIIYDALKDQFPSEGAAIIIASCCAEPIHRRLVAALAACAREERLDEARWWQHSIGVDHTGDYADTLEQRARIAALERAVGEKASLDPQGGQHES